MSTIDPGIEDGIAKGADNIEDEGFDKEVERAKEEEEDLMDPSRYWFMSTACPLLAGTFGPIANGFSILALVYDWRVYIPEGWSEHVGKKIQDPEWLIAINAVSLVAALVANMSLLLNMAKRLKFSIAQPITISGFFLSAILLIADIAALTSCDDYCITYAPAIPHSRHALSSAPYYAMFAAGIYIIIAFLMGLTVWGASRGYYKKDFKLTTSQRTLMLQTMSFVAYLLLGALVFCKVEGWEYLDAVYWADVTLLTVGLGDFSPGTKVGKGLLFPFAIGGVLIVGLVIGSIRTLGLERGKEKLSARITEKKRAYATKHVNSRKGTIRMGTFASAKFDSSPALTPAERRKEEFETMRKVQEAAERERRWMALLTSLSMALILWFAGAAVFWRSERQQGWSYFQALYFSYTSLLTIGYGDYAPISNFGRPFFVLWSLLSVPALTILISNMGDTIVKWVTDITDWLGAITVLPNEEGFRHSAKQLMAQLLTTSRLETKSFMPPGLLGETRRKRAKHREDARRERENDLILDRLAERLSPHVEDDDLRDLDSLSEDERLLKDTLFYHYLLSRETRNLQRDLNISPPKQYRWGDWEYFLKLMGNVPQQSQQRSFPGQKHADALAPEALRAPPSTSLSSDSTAAEAETQPAPQTWKQGNEAGGEQHWSWLSSESPLMGTKTESEWLLERLSAALERELNRYRKGYKKKPPVSMSEMREHIESFKSKSSADSGEASQ